jgi:hypothetical protein
LRQQAVSRHRKEDPGLPLKHQQDADIDGSAERDDPANRGNPQAESAQRICHGKSVGTMPVRMKPTTT